MSESNPNRPWYIHDQEWYVLTDSNLAKQLIQPELLRAGRLTDSAQADAAASHWERVTHRDSIAIEHHYQAQPRDGTPPTRLSTDRLVIVSDAGLGKTAATEWLEYRLNQTESTGVAIENARQRSIAFRVVLADWVASYSQLRAGGKSQIYNHLVSALAHRWSETCNGQNVKFEPSLAEQQIQSLIRQGRVTLIVDGLDQSPKQNFDVLKWIRDDSQLKNLRLIFAGRSSVVQSHWQQLFADGDWTYIRVDDFNRKQQVRYLGWLPDRAGATGESRLRYRKIDMDARAIMSVPRVLSYLYQVDDFSDLPTPAAVYLMAIDRMIADGLAKYGETVNDDDCRALMNLLSVIAAQTMVFWQGDGDDVISFQPVEHADGGWRFDTPPDYHGTLEPGYDYEMHAGDEGIGDFEELKRQIQQRYATIETGRDFANDWNTLGQINAILNGGLFEDSRFGLNQIVWANRSLHEFLLAYFFANHATQTETYRLWNWIYMRRHPATDQFYPFWMFLCEMPAKRCNSTAWLQSIRLLYQGTFWDGQNPDSRFAKRSPEMIYRSWEKLNRFRNSKRPQIKKLANRILDDWQHEFRHDYCGGQYGDSCQQAAQYLKHDHLMPISGGTVIMGTLPEIEVPQSARQHQREIFDRWVEETKNGGDPLKNELDSWGSWDTRADKRFRETYELNIRPTIAAGDFERYLQARWHVGNESEYETTVDDFQLARTTISNRHFRLFDPGHGIDGSDATSYSQWSETPDHPAIRISFFDAWVYSQWLFWEGASCRLPWESEWEYAAKLGVESEQWHQAYPVYDTDSQAENIEQLAKLRINCKETKLKQTVIPSSEHASAASRDQDPIGIGLCDLLGNTWEWCQDVYRHHYRSGHQTEDAKNDVYVFRSCRGGSFGNNAYSIRCSYRNDVAPSSADDDDGFRVARAKSGKS